MSVHSSQESIIMSVDNLFINLDTAFKLIRKFDGSKRKFVIEFIHMCKLALGSIRKIDRQI